MESSSRRWNRARRHVAAAALVLIVAAPGLIEVRRDPGEKVRALIERPLELLGDSRESVESVLGPPAEMDVGVHPNRHRDSATDTLYRLVYPSLGVEVYEAMSGSGERRQLLVSVTLTRSDRRFSDDLMLGTSRSRIVSLLGAPDRESVGVLEYRSEGELAEESAYSVALYLHEGRLRRMTWSYPID